MASPYILRFQEACIEPEDTPFAATGTRTETLVAREASDSDNDFPPLNAISKKSSAVAGTQTITNRAEAMDSDRRAAAYLAIPR